MSVLKSKRQQSPLEYSNNFVLLLDYTNIKLNSVPKRKWEYLCKPITDIMNQTYVYIQQTLDKFLKNDFTSKSKHDQAIIIISKLLSLQKPLFTLWNIQEYPEEKMITWCDKIDTEINFIKRYGGIDTVVSHMMIIDSKSSQMKFISNLGEIQKLLYSKILDQSAILRNTRGFLILDLISEAYYHIIKANEKIPQTKQEYEDRRKHISMAINSLNSAEQPIANMMYIGNFNNESITKICELLEEENRLLSGLQKSDKERFKNLI